MKAYYGCLKPMGVEITAKISHQDNKSEGMGEELGVQKEMKAMT